MTHFGNRLDRLLIFDGDDTLWDTQALYNDAKRRFFQYLEQFECDPRSVAEYFEAEDLANVASLGFTLRRFEYSIRNTAEAFCPVGSKDRDRLEKLIRSILASIENGATPLINGAKRLLTDLAPHYHVTLMTKGDQVLQEHRISSSGLRRSFERVYIVAEKSPDCFQRILRETHVDARNAWSIGNSLRSDIQPALTVGMNAIWIKRTTWAWEDVIDHVDQSVSTVPVLEDIRSILIPTQG